MKILIAEDETTLATVLKERFGESGFEVMTAEDGEKAFDAVRKFNPDLILLDLIMPQKDGFWVLKNLKVDPDLALIPVIVLSNLGSEEDVKKALQMGAKDYFVKIHHPVQEIIDKVKGVLYEKSK